MTVQIASGTYREKLAVGTVPAATALHLVGSGASTTTIDAQQSGTVASVVAGTLTADGLTFTGGSSTNFGGGLIAGAGANLTVTDSVVTGNRSVNFGGGIASYGVLRLVRSTLSNNTSTTTGGGGLSSQGGSVTITDSTVSGNSAVFAGGVDSRTPTTVTGSTISGNSVTNSANGAGLRVGGSPLTLTNSTLSGNLGSSALIVAGGLSTISGSTLSGDTPTALLVVQAPGILTFRGSVLSNTGPACSGPAADVGSNVASDATCGGGAGNGSKVSSVAAIGLKPLAANGSSGPWTMAIDAGSSAHRMVPAGSCLPTDERGQSRPGGGTGARFCDAGAFELQDPSLSAIYVSPSGDDASGCGSQADPCRTVQQGVEESRYATADDVVVHVAAGTYTETVDTGVWPTGRSLTLDGAGAASTTIDASGAGTVLSLSSGSVVVSDLTLTGGDRFGGGGGVRTTGDLRLNRVEVVGNTSDAGGGAFVGGGSLTVTSSTFADNIGDLAGGGALFVKGGVVSVATSTFTGNDGVGAAIFNDGGAVTVSASTLAANGPDDGLGAIVRLSGTVTIEGSILSESGCGSSVTDGGHNVASDDSCGLDEANGNVVGAVDEIGLAPLGDFGGPTRTMPPKSFSLAAFPPDNRVPAGSAGCPASAGTDQRGVARPKDGGCDIGAVELAPTSLQAALVDGRLTATATSATSVPADLPELVGAVTFAQGYRTLTGCEQVPVDSAGRMTCTPDSLVGPLYSTFESTNGYAYSRDIVSGIQSIEITPSSGTVDLGDAEAYTVEAFDGDGESLGDLTSSVTFTIAPDGSCVGAVCTPTEAGVHTVTATLDGLTATASLDVRAAPGDPAGPPAGPGEGPADSGPGSDPAPNAGPAAALPRTGADSPVQLALLGLLLLVTGAALVGVLRARPTS
jgi:LPXTG-motif cell wall-anchored protein